MRNKRIKGRIISIAVMSLCILSLAACGLENASESAGEEKQIVSEQAEEEDVSKTEEDEIEVSYEELREGDTAPDFTAPLADGNTFTLSENSGKVVLLNFWATWCGPCVGEMPAFQNLYEEYGDQIAILAVNCMEDKESIDRFIEETGYTFPIAYDVEGEVVMKYPSSGIPYTLVIGADGVIKKIYVGAADAETQYQVYKSAIEAVLSE